MNCPNCGDFMRYETVFSKDSFDIPTDLSHCSACGIFTEIKNCAYVDLFLAETGKIASERCIEQALVGDKDDEKLKNSSWYCKKHFPEMRERRLKQLQKQALQAQVDREKREGLTEAVKEVFRAYKAGEL